GGQETGGHRNTRTNSNPIFDVMFVQQNINHSPKEMRRIRDLAVKPYENDELLHDSKFDMTLIAMAADRDLELICEYSTALFKEKTIKRYATYFKKIIAEILDTGKQEIKLSEIHIIPEEEKKRLLVEFNETGAPYPHKTIHRLFEEQVAMTPDSIAVVGKVTITMTTGSKRESAVQTRETPGKGLFQLTNRELNEKSGGLAGVLQTKGIGAGTIVAVMLERSPDLIISLLAILKTGAAYLPVDTALPANRVEYMLQDSGTGLLLTRDSFYKNREARTGSRSIAPMDEDLYRNSTTGTVETMDPVNSEARGDINHTGVDIEAAEPAYIIYTSGTTGKPKGVVVGHKGIASLRTYWRDKFKISGRDRILQFAGISFDASVWETYMALLNGATLNLLTETEIENYDNFIKHMNRWSITVATLPPVYAVHLAPGQMKALRMLITAGSSPGIDLAARWRDSVEYINAYGPTETTICATWWKDQNKTHDEQAIVPIGKPITNTKIYILDRHMQLKPIGVPGELCIGGEGVALGYLNRPELTAEKFETADPSFSDNQYPITNTPLYRTGDLARWLEDGNIEFMGRIDTQVKIRGFRIELGEIETRLREQEEIENAVVIDHPDDTGENYLCAYLVTPTKEEIQPVKLIRKLAENLPNYMIPAYFIKLDSIPLTTSGKVDRKALPEPLKTTMQQYVAPRDHQEENLVEIWSQVLGVDKDQIGIETNFFAIGGHSLKATLLTTRIHKEFAVKVPLAEIFKNPDIRRMAQYIKTVEKETYHTIEAAAKKEYYALSSAQKRLYILQQMD
ncbi:MAG: amino acid adenylation domain-containing protein, partial [bacterium]|nr:amino acid adenylation domain-containing protein [bacterium]